MKELYTKPVSELEKFENVDVLTTSPTVDGGIQEGEGGED